jgi:hypothetical protein
MTMRPKITALGCAGVLVLSACTQMTPSDQSALAGGLTGAAFGAVTAKMLEADDNWVIAGALAGAAVGTLVAQNAATQECAYARGDGTYVIRPCP